MAMAGLRSWTALRHLPRLRLLSNERIVLWHEGEVAKMEPLSHVCRGCGWELQSEDPNALGYVPPSKLEPPPPPGPDEMGLVDPEPPEIPICVRCHRVLYHNEVVIDAPDQSKKLATLRNRDGLVLLLVDFFDIQGTLPSSFVADVSGDNPVILVGNKVDLLPSGATDYRLRMWLADQASSVFLSFLSSSFFFSFNGFLHCLTIFLVACCCRCLLLCCRLRRRRLD
jgi:hypothetical protein